MQTRRLNEFFIELAVEFKHSQPLSQENWEIAQLFYTIQGVNHKLVEIPGQSTITIILPLTHQKSCLVIDDVVSVRRLIERMLGSYGIQVFGLDDSGQALTLAQLMKPDFILLDILMPKMDGWELIKSLKSHPETSAIPVIICSVLFEPELSRAVGAEGYIRKPINRLELIRALQELKLIDGEDKESACRFNGKHPAVTPFRMDYSVSIQDNFPCKWQRRFAGRHSCNQLKGW